MYLCVETQTLYSVSALQGIARTEFERLGIDDQPFAEWFENVLDDYEFSNEVEYIS